MHMRTCMYLKASAVSASSFLQFHVGQFHAACRFHSMQNVLIGILEGDYSRHPSGCTVQGAYYLSIPRHARSFLYKSMAARCAQAANWGIKAFLASRGRKRKKNNHQSDACP